METTRYNVDRLEVRSHWRDRLQYGIVVPVLSVGFGVLVVVGPPPPSLPAMLALRGFGLLLVTTGIQFALTAWRSRLIIGPSGLVVRRAVREDLVPWNRLEHVTVGSAHSYAGVRGRGTRWGALHVGIEGGRLPLVVAATNRPKGTLPELVAEVDAALAYYGHRVQPEP